MRSSWYVELMTLHCQLSTRCYVAAASWAASSVQLTALLTMMNAQPLAYNRDMQEDKRYIFFAFDTVDACLTMAAAIVLHTTLQPERIAARLDEGFADATVMAEYLVSRGVSGDRLRTISYGEERPKYDNSREETRRLNRRAALTVNVR